MTHLIPTHTAAFNGATQTLVDARTLHQFLKVGKDFSTWIKDRIETFKFTENLDFISLPNSGEREIQGLQGFIPGSNRIDYHLTLDMAKELAMLERSEKGRQARKYFIDLERAYRDQTRQLAHLQQLLLESKPHWQKIQAYKHKALNHAEIGKLLDLSASTVRQHVRRMERCGLLTPPPELAQQQAMLAHLQPQEPRHDPLSND